MKIENEFLSASFMQKGGQLTTLLFNGQEILKSFNSQDGDGKTMFPLLPIGNRIVGNTYTLDDEKIDLSLTDPEHKEYLHGVGWYKDWEILSHSKSQVKLSLNVKSDNGYDFNSEIVYKVLKKQFIATLNIKHLNKRPRLYGLGFHPYFTWHNDFKLYLDIHGSYKSHTGDYFLEPYSEDLPEGFISHKYFNIPKGFHNFCCGNFKKAVIKRNDCKVRLMSSMPYLMLYSDGSGKFLCLEPQSHAVDAVHFPDHGGLIKLHYGEGFKANLCLDIDYI